MVVLRHRGRRRHPHRPLHCIADCPLGRRQWLWWQRGPTPEDVQPPPPPHRHLGSGREMFWPFSLRTHSIPCCTMRTLSCSCRTPSLYHTCFSSLSPRMPAKHRDGLRAASIGTSPLIKFWTRTSSSTSACSTMRHCTTR